MNDSSKSSDALPTRILWSVTATENDVARQFTVGAIDFTPERIKEILTEIYPHYKIISVERPNENR